MDKRDMWDVFEVMRNVEDTCQIALDDMDVVIVIERKGGRLYVGAETVNGKTLSTIPVKIQNTVI